MRNLHRFLHSGQIGGHPDNPTFGRVGLEIGFVVGVECCWRDEFSWVIGPEKWMPGTAMHDIESCETGSIGANYQPADLVLMSNPLEWAIYSILACLSIL
ncbi:hypothetical protein ASPFODRAFT_53271 [Aspergillus luchuensis CBS 106.47]|uniref:Uncharacterized protein n=1 Tax=Aspergillus luchuensis (strain CBS 106.47) TaxID=1137211 RepID=A0A1M3T125_ASPLC|nr:hypothetical protein ASPFODRAFT_53271 [Aspergillus luchuensis CBS 106.47]